jgi:hypothetical protein
MDVEGQLWFRILKARRGMQARFCAEFDGPTLRVSEPEAKEFPSHESRHTSPTGTESPGG